MSGVRRLSIPTVIVSAMLAGSPAFASTLKTLYAFTGGADGGTPFAGLTYLGGALYGTTQLGGASGFGTVFKIDPSSGNETVLHSFTRADGAYPWAGLIDVGGFLYGAAFAGGAADAGTVFRLDPATGTETVLRSFKAGADGSSPIGELLDYAGLLYGTTAYGGSPGAGAGTVFKVNPRTGTETVIYRFQGGNPLAGVIALKDFYMERFTVTSRPCSGSIPSPELRPSFQSMEVLLRV